eukprot:2397205-Pyramimonas_sp.AAC.1
MRRRRRRRRMRRRSGRPCVVSLRAVALAPLVGCRLRVRSGPDASWLVSCLSALPSPLFPLPRLP